MQGCSSDVLRSVNGTASKCKTILATATEECCPARGTLAGHFTRRLSPSPMPGKRIQQRRAYLPLKRSRPRPQIYRHTTKMPDARRLATEFSGGNYVFQLQEVGARDCSETPLCSSRRRPRAANTGISADSNRCDGRASSSGGGPRPGRPEVNAKSLAQRGSRGGVPLVRCRQ